MVGFIERIYCVAFPVGSSAGYSIVKAMTSNSVFCFSRVTARSDLSRNSHIWDLLRERSQSLRYDL